MRKTSGRTDSRAFVAVRLAVAGDGHSRKRGSRINTADSIWLCNISVTVAVKHPGSTSH
jgi:hypothetical protein